MFSKFQMIARIALGLIYGVFGLNGFLHFLNMTPPPMPEVAVKFMDAMMATEYFIPVLHGTEVFCGVLLIVGFAAPLALVVLAPITVQIFLFHFYLTPETNNLILPGSMVVAHLIAMLGYWKYYGPLFSRG